MKKENSVFVRSFRYHCHGLYFLLNCTLNHSGIVRGTMQSYSDVNGDAITGKRDFHCVTG